MKVLPLALLLTGAVTVAVTIAPCAALAWDQAAMNRQIDTTNVVLNGSCSGTLVAPDKVLTANHCVGENYIDKEVTVVDDKGVVTKHTVRVKIPGAVTQIKFVNGVETEHTVVRYDVLKTDADVDLALIETKRPLTDAPAAVACTAPVRGDTVYTVSNPLVLLYANLAKGVVSSTDRSYGMLGIDDSNAHRFIQHTALMLPGSSGGALYNDAGKLIGVDVRGNVVIYFSTYTDDVNKFLAGTGVECR